jgi:hypothetical protein
MSTSIAATLLALGLSFAASTAGQAAAVPAMGVLPALQTTDTVEQAQYVVKRGVAVGPRGGVAVGPRGGVAVGPRGGVAVRGGGGGVVVAPRVVGPRVVGPRVVAPRAAVVGVPRAYVGRPFRSVGYARPWYRRPYYGTIIGGVALGTILAVAAAPRVAPAEGLCWYWADPYETRGYWDYCY